MNTTSLSTVHSRIDHPPHAPSYQARRVGLIDRIALHVGIALVKWGRRPYGESRERRANRVEQQLALLERQRSTEALYRLTTPLR